MKFKEWLTLDEARFKGFKRQFMLSNPNVPGYVANQIYNNHVSKDMKQAINNYQKDTLNSTSQQDDPSLASTIIQNQSPLPSNILYDNKFLSGVKWSKPQLIQISPLNLDSGTLRTFEQWRFGFSPQDKLVRNDSKRFDVQRNKLASQVDGNNEPIIVVRIGDKFKLIEGFHRTMIHLISLHDPEAGAPQDQIELIKHPEGLTKVDYSRWKPVSINAYVGIKQ